MKILAAFDSFKESMTACEAGEAVQRAYNNVHICPLARSEERRVGKECLRLCRSRWSPYH